MRIGYLAEQLGITPHAIRYYERRGLLPAPERGSNRYREYTEGDAQRIRLLIGLRQLDIPLDQAAETRDDVRCRTLRRGVRGTSEAARREAPRVESPDG